jgi:hypothetical protein
MRRTLWAAPLIGAAALGAFLWLKPSPSPARPGAPAPAGQQASAVQLPVAQAILYSSGVGYFQREGQVEGSGRLDLTFPAQDVNDLLKSLVLQDRGGGAITAVSYDSQAPVEKTLQSFAVNLTGNPGYGALLAQARGEKVEVALQQSSAAQPGTLTGTIIGVEKQRQPAGKDAVVEAEFLNLWCAEGMRSVKLAEVQRVRFLNPGLEAEFRRALETLAQAHDTQKKAVSLAFQGEGRREVRVAYVVENPIWKTSYRLVLSTKKDGKPLLQGWALVDNASEEDWRDVRLALVSGRPISFQMDLYQQLFVPRPVVEPELFASLRPPTYSGNMQASSPQQDSFGGHASGLGRGDAKKLKELAGVWGRLPEQERARALLEATRDMPPRYKEAVEQHFREAAKGVPGHSAGDAEIDLKEGVASSATAASLGDYFQYVIEHPVTLPRQKSALLPIVQKEVAAERVSIYNERTQAQHPLLGLRFQNTTGLHLMQGPITVFEGSSYAGDARVLDLQPKEERLLSYAIDLGTEVEPVAQRAPDRLIKVKLHKGLLYQTTKVRESKVYNVKNRSERDRTVLIEHPYRSDFALVSQDKPAERARDVYRFQLHVPAGQAAHEEVVEERDVLSTFQLTNSDDQTMRFFLSQPAVSAAAKKALGEALALKGKLSATQRDIQEQERQLKVIVDDQARLRANLKEMPPTAEAYKRYLKKFDDQETLIEKAQAAIKQLQGQEVQQRQAFEDFLAHLDVE